MPCFVIGRVRNASGETSKSVSENQGCPSGRPFLWVERYGIGRLIQKYKKEFDRPLGEGQYAPSKHNDLTLICRASMKNTTKGK